MSYITTIWMSRTTSPCSSLEVVVLSKRFLCTYAGMNFLVNISSQQEWAYLSWMVGYWMGLDVRKGLVWVETWAHGLGEIVEY